MTSMSVAKVIESAIIYNKGDVKRINHLLKVHSFSLLLGNLECLDDETQEILEVSAVLHDIGIHESERKYNSSAGKYQEIEGQSIAKEILMNLGYSEKIINRVCFLIGHHHTYNAVEGIDYQILIEADFIVNIFEDEMTLEQIESIKRKIFKTKAGINILSKLNSDINK